VGTEKVWQYIEDFNLPRLVVVNKLDRENADFEGALAQLQEHFGPRVVPVQLPIGKEEQFKGLVDLIDEKALLFSGDGKKVEVQEIPEDLRDKAAAMREKLIEAAAEMEDELLLKYLEGETLEREEILQALRRGILERKIFPVLCGAAAKNYGSGPLLDFIKNYMPSPLDRGEIEGILPESGEKTVRKTSPEEPFAALVFKTLADPTWAGSTISAFFLAACAPIRRSTTPTRKRANASASFSPCGARTSSHGGGSCRRHCRRGQAAAHGHRGYAMRPRQPLPIPAHRIP